MLVRVAVQIAKRALPARAYGWIRRAVRGRFIDEMAILADIMSCREQPGILVDVGAHYGGAFGPYLEMGWRVYAFEPDPDNRAELVRRWRHYANLSVDGRAIAGESGRELPLYGSSLSTGLSSLSDFHSSHSFKATVETVSLSDWIAESQLESCDILKIDAEGHDLFVVSSWPFDTGPVPKVIVCEFEDRKTRRLGYSSNDMADFLMDKGYVVLVSEWYPIVEYGKNHRWKRLVEYGGDAIDSEIWGNLIAVSDRAMANLVFERVGNR